MNKWISRIIILLLLGVVVGLPLLIHTSSATDTPVADQTLIIITPNNEQICYEYGRAFAQWYKQNRGQTVQIDWRAPGGTSDIERLLKSQFEHLARQQREEEGVGIDIVFGGGDYSFDAILKPGVTVTMPDGSKRSVSITQPIAADLGTQFISQVFPEPLIADKKLYDPDGHWWGSALSSFGIVYNRDVLTHIDQLHGLIEPRLWSDLADPRYRGWIALADPSHSGSVRVTYEAIIQRYGFEEGLRILRRMFANARYFTPSSSKVPVDVSAGEAAAGVCIDFYGRYQAQNIANGDRVDFVAPVGQTIVTADPIAVLRGAPHRQLAIDFVRFVLSPQGQGLLDYRIGDPIGPTRYELRRQPVRRDFYSPDNMSRLIDPVNPFDISRPMPPGTPSYFSVVPAVLHAMTMDVHEDLRAAWSTMASETDADRKQAMLEEFDRLPFTQEQLLNAPSEWKNNRLTGQGASQDQMRLDWLRFFRAQYRKVVSMESDS